MTDISYGECKQLQARLDDLLAGVMAANDAVTDYICEADEDYSRISDYSADVRKSLQQLNGFIIHLKDRELDLVIRPRNPFTASAPGSYRKARGILAAVDEVAHG